MSGDSDQGYVAQIKHTAYVNAFYGKMVHFVICIFYIAGVQKLSPLRMSNGIFLLTFVGVNSMRHIHTVLLYNESAQELIVTVLNDGPSLSDRLKALWVNANTHLFIRAGHSGTNWVM